MLRRLFFVFPNEPYAQHVLDQLIEIGISKRNIHAISASKKLKSLPEASLKLNSDSTLRAQSVIWNINLLIFAFAVIAFLITLMIGELSWIILALALLVASFFAGEQFLVNIPDVHLADFNEALAKGEILVMIDVPMSRVTEIEDLVHRRHPDAAFTA